MTNKRALYMLTHPRELTYLASRPNNKTGTKTAVFLF